MLGAQTRFCDKRRPFCDVALHFVEQGSQPYLGTCRGSIPGGVLTHFSLPSSPLPSLSGLAQSGWPQRGQERVGVVEKRVTIDGSAQRGNGIAVRR